ncbi:MAG: glycosyltransferase [bacterium]|nr:glycosyltransferase [bacterium]
MEQKIAMSFPDHFFNPLLVFYRRLTRKIFGIISLRSRSKSSRGTVLLSFVTHPFCISKKEFLKTPHTTPFECMEIASLLLDRGYAVDVIDWNNFSFTPKTKYVMIIDTHQNLERLSAILPDCVKIHYITGAHWKYQNIAETFRLGEFRKRRGATLQPRRQMLPSSNIEYADYATSLGSRFAKGTYDYAGKNIEMIPLLSTASFPSPEDKNFAEVRKNFVWIGGGGAIHKGLDLVLEVFSNLSDFRLTVCGPVEAEKDFFNFYKKELCHTPNIRFVGRINVRSEQFKNIVDNAVGLIYPSCSEGQSGSVVTALHAGLIPIITHQSGVDVSPFGLYLKDFSVQEITDSVIRVSKLPIDELRSRSTAAWKYARENHTMEIFKERYAAFIDGVIKKENL